MSLQMRPLPAKQASPSLLAKAVALLLSPVMYGIHISTAVLAWVCSNLLPAPIRLLTAVLQLADGLICDMLALLSKEPGLKSQIQACQETIASLQLTKQAQERQIALLQGELDSLKAERGKAQRKTLELSKQLQRLQQRLSRSSLDPTGPTNPYDSPTAAAAAAAADAFKPGPPDHTTPTYQRSAAAADEGPFAAAGLQAHPPHGVAVSKAYAAAAGGGGGVEYGHVPARGWYLHACVVMAGLGVRWWLLNQTDPLQRKVMLVIIWPAVWVYGGLLTNTFPNSYTLRASLACTCWALLGYVAHEMVAVSVRGRQQGLGAA